MLKFFTLFWSINEKNFNINVESTNESGDRILLIIKNFVPFFYISSKNVDVPYFGTYYLNHFKKFKNNIEVISDKFKSSNGFNINGKVDFLKIKYHNYSELKKIKKFISENKLVSYDDKFIEIAYFNEFWRKEYLLLCQEENIKTAGWNEINLNDLKKIDDSLNYDKIYEINFVPEIIKPCLDPEQNLILPNVLTCVFDIECYSSRDQKIDLMCDPTLFDDATIQISMIFKRFNERLPYKNLLLSLNFFDNDNPFSFSDNLNYEVMFFYDEIKLIKAFSRIIKQSRPFFIGGHNINGFDNNYIYRRCEHYYKNIVEILIDNYFGQIIKNYPNTFENAFKDSRFKHCSITVKKIYKKIIKYITNYEPLYQKQDTKKTEILKISKFILDKFNSNCYINSLNDMISNIKEHFYVYAEKKDEKNIKQLLKNLSLNDDEPAIFKIIKKETNAYGTLTEQMFLSKSHIILDTLKLSRIKDGQNMKDKLSSFSLNAVSKLYLNQNKEDVSHKDINEFYRNPTPENFKLMGSYCLMDSILSMKLIDAFSTLPENYAMACICFITFYDTIFSFQTTKVENVIKKNAKDLNNVLMMKIDKTLNGDQYKNKYEIFGAFVVSPEPKRYSHAVTLDFKSMYPSIIRLNNLSLDTLIGFRIYKIKGSGKLVRNSIIDKSLSEASKLDEKGNLRVKSINWDTFKPYLINNNRVLLEEKFHSNLDYCYKNFKVMEIKDVPLYSIKKKEEIKIYTDNSLLISEIENFNEFIINNEEDLNKKLTKSSKKNKSSFKSFYLLTSYFVQDSDNSNLTGFIPKQAEYLLNKRREATKEPNKITAEIGELKKKILDKKAQAIENYDDFLDKTIKYFDKEKMQEIIDDKNLREKYKDYVEDFESYIKKSLRFVIANVYQLNYKLVGNSTYGQSGTVFSIIYNLSVAASITTLGQKYIGEVRRITKETKPNSMIIYGDTDSIFVQLWQNKDEKETPDDIRQIFKESEDIAESVNKYFRDTFDKSSLVIEVEKLTLEYYPITKKKGFGLLYMVGNKFNYEKPDDMLKSGTVIKKKNYSRFIKILYEESINEVMERKPIQDIIYNASIKIINALIISKDKKMDFSLFTKSLEIKNMNVYNKKTSTYPIIYINEHAEREPTIRVDDNRRINVIHIYKPLYFTNKGSLITSKISYFQQDYEDFLALSKDEQKRNFNYFLYYQSELKGSLQKQLFKLIAPEKIDYFDNLLEENNILTFYDGSKTLINNIVKNKKFKTFKDNNNIFIKVIIFNNIETGIPEFKIEYVNNLPDNIKFYFLQTGDNINYKKPLWNESQKKYVNENI